MSDGDRNMVLKKLSALLETELNTTVLALSNADVASSSAQTIVNVLVDKYCYQCIYKSVVSKRRASNHYSIHTLIQQQMTLSQQYLDQLPSFTDDNTKDGISSNSSSSFVPKNYGQYSMHLNPVSKLEHLHFTTCLQAVSKLYNQEDNVGNNNNSMRNSSDAASVASSMSALMLSQSCITPLVIILEHAECMLTATFNDLLLLLTSSTSLKIVLVIVHTQSAPLLTIQSPTTRSLLCGCPVLRALTPFDLYDTVMANLLAAREIPVSVSAELIGWLHESYWRSNMCIQTVVDRILLCLGYHFKRRTSLLCMFEDSKWLSEMQLLTAQVKQQQQKQRPQNQLVRNIFDITSLMHAQDFADCELELTLEYQKNGICTQTSVLTLYQLMCESIGRATVDYHWFQCLLVMSFSVCGSFDVNIVLTWNFGVVAQR
jgi:hypothetical protein